MKTKCFLVVLIGLFIVSCQKRDQSGLLPHQTVDFSVGPDFEISMPGALPETIRMIALNGDFQPIGEQEEVALVLQHKGTEGFDTILLKSKFRIENLDNDYFKFINGRNVLKGKILIRNNSSWRDGKAGELTFTGQLSIVYNPK
jgi:hypothetical protein